MGAQLGSPGKTVIDIDGDASYLMTCYELATIAEYNIPVKVAILNNDFQGMVKQWQDLFYQRRYSQTVMKNPNFATMAEAFGVKGIRCDDKGDVAEDRRGDARPPRARWWSTSSSSPTSTSTRWSPAARACTRWSWGRWRRRAQLTSIHKAPACQAGAFLRPSSSPCSFRPSPGVVTSVTTYSLPTPLATFANHIWHRIHIPHR